MKIEGNRVRLHFRFADGGLASVNGGKPEGFTIAGADGRFVWADASASGDTIVVSSPQAASPVEVRYAWADNPVFGLRNGAGLPASPFRTSGPQLPVPLAVERTARNRGCAPTDPRLPLRACATKRALAIRVPPS